MVSKVVNLYSVKEAAKEQGISDSRVTVLLNDDRIEGKKPGHDWVVLSLDYKRKMRHKKVRKLLKER